MSDGEAAKKQDGVKANDIVIYQDESAPKKELIENTSKIDVNIKDETYEYDMGNGETFVINETKSETYYYSIHTYKKGDKKGETEESKNTILTAAPTEVRSYRNPLKPAEEKYAIEFKENLSGNVRFFEGTVTEIAKQLDNSASFLQRRGAGTARIISLIVNTFRRYGKIADKITKDISGFFWDDNAKKIYSVNSPIRTSYIIKTGESDGEISDLRNALEVLAKIQAHYNKTKNLRKIFSSLIRWGIIAPYIFAYKRAVNSSETFIPYPYLFGTADVGKTTLGLIVINLYRETSLSINDIEGSTVKTYPRYVERIGKQTFPITINESDAIFASNCYDVKSSISTIYPYGRLENNKYNPDFFSLSPVIFTSNSPLLGADDGTLRRLMFFEVTSEDAPKPEEKKDFKKNIRPLFRQLSSIGRFTANHINEENFIGGEWTEVSLNLLKKMYEKAQMPFPEWLNEIELKDAKEEAREQNEWRIRENLKQYIERTYGNRFQKPKEGGLSTYQMALGCIDNGGIIPWLIKLPDGEVVIAKGISEAIGLKYSLEKLADTFGLLGSGVHNPGGGKKSIRGIRVTEDELKRLFSLEDENTPPSLNPANILAKLLPKND